MAIDKEVFEGLKRGDASAFETFVETFEAPLFRFFYFELRRRDLAEELAAETFAQLVRSLPQMRGDCEQLRAFVFATARHVRLRYWRRTSRKEVPLDAALEVADTGTPAFREIERSEQIDELTRALERLDVNVRAVILLRFVEDFSIREISEALDMPIGTIKSHLHRGKQQLKEILVKMGCEP